MKTAEFLPCALARRILPDDEVPLAPPNEPDSGLLDRISTGLVLPAGATVVWEDTAPADSIIDAVAGVRLSRAETILPGLSDAVRKRVDAARNSEKQKRRLRDQFDAYADSGRKRLPDAFLASVEAVEDAIQRAAA